MIYGILFIILGALILLSLSGNIITIGIIIKGFLAAASIVFGISNFKKKTEEALASVIFGLLLVIDITIGFKNPLSFGDVFMLYIGSLLFSAGLIGIFSFKVSISMKKNDKTQEEKVFTPEKNSELKVYIDTSWSDNSVTLNEDEKNKIKVIESYKNSLFKNYILFENNELKLKNKLRFDSIKSMEKMANIIKIPENYETHIEINSNTGNLLLDLFGINNKITKIDAKASKIHIIPSSKNDSEIYIKSYLSNIIFEIPNEVFVILKHNGEFSMKDLNNFIKKDDNTYVSNNFENSKYTCTINLVSEMSKISSF
ncbi:hypothetical protein XO10_04700 [Marinitoga sp. 1135]|uniref:Uncharacterized protein n=1 Tax=Marinitoga piezophila (strain DSM 14283 / JCM 11233 / KA3) TaxID=443254 RepID=H2J7R8_MARPK|nr:MULTISPECIES: hypothetical protein [Marinitoga]AEX85409.1 hypothetical protein Marpi_0997 [Marinitoga piezophila KA3]APT75883.1 hypothetical protein LN42_05455 [Marinitoga sp. 1137]NUU95582.1 hypothetical protein [Marinitoga sp. 1135]NUU97538.1 hypothetical protein [Marinitoga sp. 1138]